jgi:hypothetical protein
MADWFELLERFTADALAGRIRGNQFRELGLKIEQLVIEPVVVLVADGGLSPDVIGMIMPAEFLGKVTVTGFSFA